MADPTVEPTAGGQRPDHLSPEERAGGDHAEPGLLDKVRGKVEDLRGDGRPRS